MATQEAAKSAEAAAESAQAAVLMSRPWLKVEYLTEAQIYDDGEAPLRLVITVKATNVGATPAISASTFATQIRDGQQETLDLEIKNFLLRKPWSSQTIFPNDSSLQTGWNIDLADRGGSPWAVAVFTSYSFAGSKRRHVSGVALRVHLIGSDPPDTTSDGTLMWQAVAHVVPNLRVDAT